MKLNELNYYHPVSWISSTNRALEQYFKSRNENGSTWITNFITCLLTGKSDLKAYNSILCYMNIKY